MYPRAMLFDRIIEAEPDNWKPSPEERAAYRSWKATGHTPKGFHFVFGRLVKIGGSGGGFKPPETKPKFATKSDPDLPLFTGGFKKEPSSGGVGGLANKQPPETKDKSKEKPKSEKPKGDSDLWKSWKPSTYSAPPKRSPEEQKIHDLAKTLRGQPLKRTAAGGLVFKSFKGEKLGDLEVLVAKTHPKWGGYWVIPKGGSDPGEHIHDTAAREAEEETGVKAKVIPDHEPFVKSSTFGESGKYDLPLVTQALKDAHPHEADFIEQHKDKLAHEHFTIENNSHYFLMQHTGGEPISHPDQSHDQEMGEARFMPLRDAYKLGPKVADVIKGMLPAIEKQWRAESGQPAEKPAVAPKQESLFARVAG